MYDVEKLISVVCDYLDAEADYKKYSLDVRKELGLAPDSNNGHIISCEACGSYFSADKLHDEEIEGHSFTACPACGKDVVEGLSRAEFEDEYFCPRYSVVVRQFDGSVRGYIVSANGRHEVMKRLLEKLDFNYIAEVSIGEILVKEDEF